MTFRAPPCSYECERQLSQYYTIVTKMCICFLVGLFFVFGVKLTILSAL
jgi:hypothetical protein